MLPFNDLQNMAMGKWSGILVECGIPRDYLSKKQGPCPICGGKTRFRFDDKFNRGNWYCNHCGSGDGFQLLEKVLGWPFKEAARRVMRICGHIEPAKQREQIDTAKAAMYLRSAWVNSKPVQTGDPVDQYLRNRGIVLNEFPAALRYHRNMAYRHDGEKGTYHAMLALITGANGNPASLHRTYLKDGQKAPVTAPKKVMTGVQTISGGAIQLFPPAEILAVTEGIETALAVHLMTGLPVWATVSAGGMESLAVPECVKQLEIYADNDANQVGQKAAAALSDRLRISTEIHIPTITGNDWLDEFTGKSKEGIRG